MTAAGPRVRAGGTGSVVAATRQSVVPAACCPGARAAASSSSPTTSRPMRCMSNVDSRLWRRQLKSTIFNRLRHLDILHCGSPNCLPPTGSGSLSGPRARTACYGSWSTSWWGATGQPLMFCKPMERERQFPTGIGYGVAVPHGKTPALANLVAVAGTARTPVPYETVDGEPVRLFFLLAGPEGQAGAHVQALSSSSRLVWIHASSGAAV